MTDNIRITVVVKDHASASLRRICEAAQALGAQPALCESSGDLVETCEHGRVTESKTADANSG